ncbi:MAG TPA: glycosyltransferase [Phycisphaerae bacterium]|nr:glycosyltransferase [Phycisphaerae bacterium]
MSKAYQICDAKDSRKWAEWAEFLAKEGQRLLSMLEALACGTIVSTNVSGASEMIILGVDGFILENREPAEMSKVMRLSLAMPDAAGISIRLAQRYALRHLERDLRAVWPALGAAPKPGQNQGP